MQLLIGRDGLPLFSSSRVFVNFLLLVLCSQFAFSVLAMRGALLPQMLDLWEISKTQFGILMTIYGVVHNVFYLCLAWAQDRFSTRSLISINMVLGGVTTFFLGKTTDFATLCFSWFRFLIKFLDVLIVFLYIVIILYNVTEFKFII